VGLIFETYLAGHVAGDLCDGDEQDGAPTRTGTRCVDAGKVRRENARNGDGAEQTEAGAISASFAPEASTRRVMSFACAPSARRMPNSPMRWAPVR